MYFDMKEIPEFPNYDVSVDGRVFNNKTRREMVLTPTMQGELTVGLMRDGTQHRRSVKVLVAEAFVDGRSEVSNTPIVLDGNKYNLNADNIRWRPRWFAWRYARQFSDVRPSWFYNGPIYDLLYNVQYLSIIEASITNGVLCDDIHDSLLNETPVFPTSQRYVYI